MNGIELLVAVSPLTGPLIIAGIVFTVVVIIPGLYTLTIYNGLRRAQVRAQTAFSQIDVQLKRRHDLIPNLVETVKGYAKHERETLEAVIAARARAVSAGSISEKVAAEGGLTQALGRLMAIAEAYPDLKANTNFMQLQGELATTENIISNARGGYNGAAGGYNQTLVVFPTNIVAGMFGFKQEPFFELDSPAERVAPQVKF